MIFYFLFFWGLPLGAHRFSVGRVTLSEVPVINQEGIIEVPVINPG